MVGHVNIELLHQAIDKDNRYRPVKHEIIQPGDVVLLVEPFTKQYHYPSGRVLSVETNTLGEVVRAIVKKGNTRERVDRHVSSLILLMRPKMETDVINDPTVQEQPVEPGSSYSTPRHKRRAARECKQRNKQLLQDDLI